MDSVKHTWLYFLYCRGFVQQGRTFNVVESIFNMWNELWDLTREAFPQNELIISWESCELWKWCKNSGALQYEEIIGEFWRPLLLWTRTWGGRNHTDTEVHDKAKVKANNVKMILFFVDGYINVLITVDVIRTFKRMFCTVPHSVPASSGIELQVK